MEKIQLERDGKISELELGEKQQAMKQTYAYFTIRKEGKLIAFARVVSDGFIYAFIVDVYVRSEFQHRELGTKLLRFIIEEMKKDGIRRVQIIFDKKLEPFYKKTGFNTEFLAGDLILNTGF